MGSQESESRRSRRRLVIAACLTVGGAAAVAVAITVGGIRLNGGSQAMPSAERSARERCAADVLKRLVSPSTATLTDVRTDPSTLDTDGRDLFPLTLDEPLKGVERSRITVLNVSGVVNSPNEVGSVIRDHFDCRAYFVDGSLAHTLVLFDHGH
ncbi:hypothetical protein ORI20_02360 [Mycobacterium sp. CVI_P3]|uniref:LytR/CpsA/Psr regulator C-terminal domain-containing protein n=1 Tax=Mycobacterium pinniadriaticum TaxID=2994102 RepID=A0ABT3S7Q2_9MYCO|nr:hypothetical protein [Mycobacterium pinniadriaticum]MCX2929101.1 hypothetical protein [Mycobacterium pinniadriaticum]MCX2935526.1 hypothetical protein [Mycobacterium pinniadriaticum]